MKRALRVVLAAGAGAGSCSADAEDIAGSPCVAFAKASAPSLRAEPLSATRSASPLLRVRAGAGRSSGLDAAGNLGSLEAGSGTPLSDVAAGSVGGSDFVVTKDVRGAVVALVARWHAAATGTVAVKTFAVDGKRVETRLLVQHDLEDWTGYAWNEAGTAAELVNGNREAMLPRGKSWYFPSHADCTACHTPAAAVDAPLPATSEARARSYLHANCRRAIARAA